MTDTTGLTPQSDILRRAARVARALEDPCWLAVAEWMEATAKQEEYTRAEFGYRSAPTEALDAARALMGEA